MTRQRKQLLIVLIIVIVLGAIAVAAVANTFTALSQFGSASGVDQLFGEQHLKTVVALLELHKTRYGVYPASLDDLKFTGQWDQAALMNVRYSPNPDRTAYYVEVTRGWLGRPELTLPAEFWQGTGYRAELRPAR